MDRKYISSSMINSIGYDPETETLEIEFSGGAVWQYSDVPADVWDDFESSGSQGRFFHQNIKGQYAEARA